MQKTGEIHECIENPPVIPQLFEEVWAWFLELNNQRQETNSISWSDMQAYFTLKHERPSQWDLDIIQALDSQYLSIMLSDDKADVLTV